MSLHTCLCVCARMCVAFLKVMERQTVRRGQSTRTKGNQEASNPVEGASVSSPLKKTVELRSSGYMASAPIGNIGDNSSSIEPTRQRTTGEENSSDRTRELSEKGMRLLSDFSEQDLERELARRRQLKDPTAAGGMDDNTTGRDRVVTKGSACGGENGAVCVPCFELA